MDRAHPIPFCTWTHFGVDVNPALPPRGVRAWWTQVTKHDQIPVPFQWWLLSESQSGLVEWLNLSPTFPGPVLIRREIAVSPEMIPLDVMQFDYLELPWVPFDTITLEPGQVNTDLMIPLDPMMQGYLERYEVSLLPGPVEIVTRFVTQAVVVESQIREVLINFDVHQNVPSMLFDNLELDPFGDWITPAMIRAIYSGTLFPSVLAWGLPAIPRPFPPGRFPQMPELGGIEIT